MRIRKALIRLASLSPLTALSLIWLINSLGVSLIGFCRPILIGFGALDVSFTLSGSLEGLEAFLRGFGYCIGLSGPFLAMSA